MMSEETLNRLFEQARTAEPETDLSQIQRWIGVGGLAILSAKLLAKFKLLTILKPFIMITSAIVTIGIGTGLFLVMNTSEESAASAAKKAQTKAPAHWVADPEKTTNVPGMLEFERQTQGSNAPGALPDNKDYGSFKALKISDAVHVVLIQGSKAGVRLEGDEKGKELVVITNTNETLDISLDCKKDDCDFELTIYVTVEDLEKISSSGASKIDGQGELKFDNLNVTASGASNIELNMTVTDLVVHATGAVELDLSGSTEKLKLKNEGASQVEATKFKAKNADVTCTGASHASVNVSNTINVEASGASTVEYSGSATVGKQAVTGASSLKKM